MAKRSRDVPGPSPSPSPGPGTGPRPALGPGPGPAPGPGSSATELFDFADALALFSSDVLQYRLKHKAALSPDERSDLEDVEMKLDVQTAQVRAAGIAELGEMTAGDRAEVRAATQEARDFLARIKKAERVIAIAGAILGLAGAIVARDWKAAGKDARQIRKLTA